CGYFSVNCAHLWITLDKYVDKLPIVLHTYSQNLRLFYKISCSFKLQGKLSTVYKLSDKCIYVTTLISSSFYKLIVKQTSNLVKMILSCHHGKRLRIMHKSSPITQ